MSVQPIPQRTSGLPFQTLHVVLFVWAAVAIAAARPCFAAADDIVVVGSKKFTENVILGEIARQLVSETGVEAKHLQELGGTRILWNALLSGDIDVYPDYTGTIAHEILTDKAVSDDETMRAALAEKGVVMSRPFGFHNNYALGMKESVAEQLSVHTIGDLRNHADLKFGFSSEFMEREDGWPGLRQRYRLPQKDVQGLDHDLAYRGIEADKLQVLDMYTTDADIAFYNMRVLEDDLQYFPVYQAVWLYRKDLESRPQVVRSLQKVEGAITQQQMVAMNGRAKLDRTPSGQVAGEFLKEKFGLQTDMQVESRWSQLLVYTGAHLSLVVLSLIPAIVVAIVLGVVAAKWSWFGHIILATVSIIQTIPALAILVILIPVLGLGSPPAIFALFLYSLLPIVRATHQGLTGIPPNLMESAIALGLPARARFRRIELPMAMPSIVSGIKVAAVINVGFATLGALIGAGGYGQPILTGIRLDDTGLILLGAIPSAVLALLVQWLFDVSERWIVPQGLRL